MITVEGKGGIKASIVAHSKSAVTGKEIVTFQVVHHRFILAEMNKHRQLSNSYQSSRAVPVHKAIDDVIENTAYPVFWGKNQAGMQAIEECNNLVDPFEAGDGHTREKVWGYARNSAIEYAQAYDRNCYHKQIVGRLLEPFQYTTGIITATEWDNFFYLRRDSAAQPEFKELADCMWEALQQSVPEVLCYGEWHTPFVNHYRDFRGGLWYSLSKEEAPSNDEFLTAGQALKYSAASCAQVSFRKLDQSIETLDRVWDRCFNSGIPHSVVAEHQATPMENEFGECYTKNGNSYEKGVTHNTIDGQGWSGNLKHWIQHRQLIPNNVCTNYGGE